MIKLIDHTTSKASEEIYHLFQASYQIEADMVGVDNFPPLQRSSNMIRQSATIFYGFWEGNELAGAIELSMEGEELHICSLVVSPDHFRKGIGKSLIEYSLKNHRMKEAMVETAAVNQPAISLYERVGFKEELTYMTGVGIEKIRLRRTND